MRTTNVRSVCMYFTHSIYYSINVQGSLWMCYKLVI